MEEMNVGESHDNELPLNGIENIQNQQNSNGLFGHNEEISCQEKKNVDANETETNTMTDWFHVDEIDLLSDPIDDDADADDMQPVNQTKLPKRKPTKSSEKENRRYMPAWERLPQVFYRTYVYDISNIRHEKLICWLYKGTNKNGKDTLRCKLCEKYQKTENSNGRPNLWCTSGYEDLRVARIKEHNANEVHQDAQRLELAKKSHTQPSWPAVQAKERSKHEIAVQNLILAAVHICKQDQSINSFENLCRLLEAVDVKLLPAELGGISYRNDCAALEFLHHVAAYLHGEIVKKVKQSPSIGRKKQNLEILILLIA